MGSRCTRPKHTLLQARHPFDRNIRWNARLRVHFDPNVPVYRTQTQDMVGRGFHRAPCWHHAAAISRHRPRLPPQYFDIYFRIWECWCGSLFFAVDVRCSSVRVVFGVCRASEISIARKLAPHPLRTVRVVGEAVDCTF